MNLVIHIGTEKTGTSTIQEFLHINRGELKNQGIAYLKSLGERNNRNIVTYCIDNSRTDDHIVDLGITTPTLRRKWEDQFLINFKNEISRLNRDISDVIISSEHFHSRLVSEEEIKSLQELVVPYFENIKILVYLRRQDQVDVSLYSTFCRVGRSRSSVLNRNIMPNNKYYNYKMLLDRWSKVFGKDNIDARVFDKNHFHEGKLMYDFFNSTGIEKSSAFVFPSSANEKLDVSIQHIIRLINMLFPRDVDGYLIAANNGLRENMIRSLESKYKGPSKLPTKKEALQFYKKFHKSNQELSRKYFDVENIFSDDFSMYPEKAHRKKLSDEFIMDAFYAISGFLKKSGQTVALSLFKSVLSFLDNHFIISNKDLDSINLYMDSGAILRDIALGYEDQHPEIALFLMKEARKYRPNGPLILDKIEKLESIVLEKNTSKNTH